MPVKASKCVGTQKNQQISLCFAEKVLAEQPKRLGNTAFHEPAEFHFLIKNKGSYQKWQLGTTGKVFSLEPG